MTLTTIPYNSPTYSALSTDIVENKITGASVIGAKVFITDTKQSYIISNDLTLVSENVTTTSVTPQVSTNAFVDVTGSTINATSLSFVNYTLGNSGANTITYKVLGANVSDFTNAQTVSTADITAGSNTVVTSNPAIYSYYKVQVESKVDDTPGTITVQGIGKSL